MNVNNCSIELNSMTLINYKSREGGAISIYNDSRCEIVNSTLANNNIDWVGKGGAIYSDNSMCTLTNSTLTKTRVVFDYYEGYGDGGGTGYGVIYTKKSNCTITNSILSDNYYDYGDGGAIYSTDSIYTITNSILTNNGLKSFGGSGGAICMRKSKFNIINSTITKNSIYSFDGSATLGGAIYSHSSIVILLIQT